MKKPVLRVNLQLKQKSQKRVKQEIQDLQTVHFIKSNTQ